MRKRALVTGASGFVGANLARDLIARGHDVHLLLRPGHKPWRIEEILDTVAVQEGDLTDRRSLERALGRSRPDWIFHLAAYGAYPEQRDLDQMIATNLHGTANLLAAAEGVGFEAFVNSGSSSEYGYKDHAPSEDELLEPNSDYAVAKAATTLLCRHAARSRNLPITTLRLYSAYGPFEEPSRLVPKLIVRGLEGALPPLVNPKVARDYVHAADVCEAYVLAAAGASAGVGAVYNVGSGVQTTLAEIVAIARRLMAIADEPDWGSMPERSWDTDVWVSDPRRIKSELGWEPRFDLERGLKATLEWFEQNPRRLELYRAAARTRR